MDEFDPRNINIYELLEIEINSSESEIKRAYRKKALQYHPDKNPDNPDAAKEFHKLRKILEILTDKPAREAYNKVLLAKRQAAERHKQLDAKRKKFKEDLEAREKLSSKLYQENNAENQLQKEIERLRKEGSKEVEREVAYVLNQLSVQFASGSNNTDGSKYKIKMKWCIKKDSPTNCEYSYDNLYKFLSKYGDIEGLVVSSKTGTALVEFKNKNAAELAFDCEIGLASNPLQLEWVDSSIVKRKSTSTLIKDSDFESVVFTKMRQAEERKRLIEQLQKEENNL